MTKEQIEQIARDEWVNLNMGEGLDDSIYACSWVHWKMAFEIALSKYEWTDADMREAFEQGELQNKQLSSGGWLQSYETKQQTRT